MKKIVLFLACGLLIGNMAFAQAQKFGYIDSRELLKAMPEMTKAESDIQAYTKQFQDQLQSMSAEYEKKVKEFQAAEKTMTDAVKEVKVKEIQDLEGRIQSTNQSAQEKVEKKRHEKTWGLSTIRSINHEQNWHRSCHRPCHGCECGRRGNGQRGFVRWGRLFRGR